MEKWRNEGYIVEKVEYWNAFAKQRRDLFNYCDVVAECEGEEVRIQVTSYSNISARINKIMGKVKGREYIKEHARRFLTVKGHRLIVEGWHQPKGPRTKWVARVIELTLDDFK